VTDPRSDSLRLELDVPAEARVGSTVPITLRARNSDDRPIDLYLRGRTIAFDIIVRRSDGEVVWRRLANEIIPAILRLETLAPREVLELHAVWNLDTNAGRAVPSGLYVVQGLLLTDGPELRTDAVTVRVTAT
jgi:hypothetical protein